MTANYVDFSKHLKKPDLVFSEPERLGVDSMLIQVVINNRD